MVVCVFSSNPQTKVRSSKTLWKTEERSQLGRTEGTSLSPEVRRGNHWLPFTLFSRLPASTAPNLSSLPPHPSLRGPPLSPRRHKEKSKAIHAIQEQREAWVHLVDLLQPRQLVSFLTIGDGQNEAWSHSSSLLISSPAWQNRTPCWEMGCQREVVQKANK